MRVGLDIGTGNRERFHFLGLLVKAAIPWWAEGRKYEVGENIGEKENVLAYGDPNLSLGTGNVK